MKTPRGQLAKLIARRTLNAGLSKQEATSIAAYLLEERRASELASLMRDIQADWAQNGYVEVIAGAVHKLTPAVLKDIEAEARKVYPEAKQIVVTEQLQPDLVGGVKLMIIDHQLDLTTKGKLQEFKMLAMQGKD